jgi:hypothetical protein
MSLAGLISGRNISNLDHNQLRAILNTLLIVESDASRETSIFPAETTILMAE